ncbi:MAG: mechanosensitive ion channel family protein [Spirulina sp.]
MSTPLKRFFALALTFLLAMVLSLALGQPSQAQFSFPEGFGQKGVIGPPPEVTRYGNMEAISVQSPLSENNLFTIASPTVYDRSMDSLSGRQTVEQRAEEIQAKLLLLLQRPMDPETLVFEVSQLNNVAIIDVRDDQFPRPLVLLSITEFDADFNGQPIDILAEEWRDILEAELRSGLEQLPAARRRINHILTGVLLSSFGIIALKYALSKPQGRLRRQKKALQSAPLPDAAIPEFAVIPESSPGDGGTTVEESLILRRTDFLQRLPQIFNLDRQLAALEILQWLLFWLLMAILYGGFFWLAKVSIYLIRNQFHILDMLLSLLLVWFVTGLAIRISRRLIDRFITRWNPLDLIDFIEVGDSQRLNLRTSTIAGAMKGLATVVILLAGVLSGLNTLGLSTASVIAIGSLAGLAITFGSQNLVKDLVNGFLILAEDQYAIGDVIDLGSQTTGLVENLNMRVTQIRSSHGELITIPNSSITQVKNLTRSWSRVNFSIDVAYHTDPDHALTVMRAVAQDLYDDPLWHDKILSAPKILGIDSVSHSGLTITTWIQTEPGQHMAVGREFRLRVRRALEANGIEIGIPQYYSLDGAMKLDSHPMLPLTQRPDDRNNGHP